MNKSEIVNKISKKTGFSKANSVKALEAVEDVITEALIAGDKVQLVGFGMFETVDRASKEGRNPATGETLTIAARKAPRFKAGKALKDAVNK